MMFGIFSSLFGRAPRNGEFISPKSAGQTAALLHTGGTFNAGRNKEKRRARQRQKILRADEVTWYQRGMTPKPAKRTLTDLMTQMLANRRLRQRSGSL